MINAGSVHSEGRSIVESSLPECFLWPRWEVSELTGVESNGSRRKLGTAGLIPAQRWSCSHWNWWFKLCDGEKFTVPEFSPDFLSSFTCMEPPRPPSLCMLCLLLYGAPLHCKSGNMDIWKKSHPPTSFFVNNICCQERTKARCFADCAPFLFLYCMLIVPPWRPHILFSLSSTHHRSGSEYTQEFFP